MHRHWTDDELVEALYGIGPDSADLDLCPECGERWSRLLALRREASAPPELSPGLLAAQRQRIHARLEKPERRGVARLVPALAAAALFVLGLALQAPSPAPLTSEADSKLLVEVYSLVSNPEPSAVTPIRALFEGGGE